MAFSALTVSVVVAWQFAARAGLGGLTADQAMLASALFPLLLAYALLRRDHPALRLVIAGGETLFDYREYRAEWESRATRLGLDPLVLGPVAHDDLPALVAAASVFALLRELHRERAMTTIVVTHNPDLAARCDRLFTMSREGISPSTGLPERG